MDTLAIPEGARQHLQQLFSAYARSKRDLTRFAEGLLLGMGLSPNDWELDTYAMQLIRQERTEGGADATTHQRGELSSKR